MWMASIQGKLMYWILTHVPGVYSFVIKQNVRYEMGKQEQGEMQSIWALNRVVRQIEKQGIPLARVKEVIQLAEREKVSNVEFPRFIGRTLLGVDETDKLLSGFVDY